ncbi:hypothetical protein [Micromonospora okii]|uniref:hypothetical protein n=1 Tax=Micromonospora okii TaxID=1182970 RepID=UPI001E3D5A70|nr:hypothetical protein [Micromonospora okii]
MTEQFDLTSTTADPGPLNFKLWLPRWESSQRQLHCHFYATTTGLTQINEGSPDCMTQFLSDLGRPDARVTNWSVKRYRATYFSDFPDAEGWEDRLVLTWAVEIRADRTADPEDAGTHAPGPHGSYAYDATFADEDEDWERTREHVLVVAGTAYGPRVEATSLELPPAVRSASDHIFEGMVAVDLGELDFPADLPQVDEVLARCRDRGLHTNWKDRTLWLDSRAP